MKKMSKRIEEIVGILIIILISIIAFVGIWKKENGIWKNIIPDYKYGMDIKGTRELIYTIDTSAEDKYVYVDEAGNIKGEVWKDGNNITEENEDANNESENVEYSKETRNIKKNEDNNLTKENFEKAKTIIQKRLKNEKIGEYDIRIDDVTGGLVIESKNDDNEISKITNLITNPGKLQIIDYQNGLVLLDNSNIKKSSVVSSNNNGYAVYLQLEFNKDSIEKLKEISNKYIETEKEENKKEDQDENQENVEDSEKEIKYISIVVDGTKLMKTYFSDEISQGIIQIPIGNQANDYEKFIENSNYAKLISTRLNTGILPIEYELETDNFVKSEFNLQNCRNLLIFGISFIVIASIAFIIKYRKNGLLGAILCIGYIGTLTIVIKYTNTEITQNSIITAFLMIFLNYIFVKLLLKKLINIPNDIDKAYLEVSKKFYLSIIPIVIISLVFTLDSNYIINTIGMMVFWNIVLNIIYNLLFTKNILKK